MHSTGKKVSKCLLTLSLNIIIVWVRVGWDPFFIMAKTLCDWSRKDILKKSDELALIVGTPEFVCRKCARVSGSKKHLCAAVRLDLPSVLPFPDLKSKATKKRRSF